MPIGLVGVVVFEATTASWIKRTETHSVEFWRAAHSSGWIACNLGYAVAAAGDDGDEDGELKENPRSAPKKLPSEAAAVWLGVSENPPACPSRH